MSEQESRSARSVRLDVLIEGLELSALRSPRVEWPLIEEVTLDLAEAGPGVLFIARRLWYSNTHEQVREALERGVAAVLVSERSPVIESLLSEELARSSDEERVAPILYSPDEDPTLGLLCDRFYGQPTSQLRVYGVTGTNGKTSAVSYLAELLSVAGERVAVIGTVEYRFEERSIPAPNTTPDALVIHRFARRALDLGATALALEVSSHALSLWRVAGVAFDAVGFTSWGRDHLDFHGSLEAYREAKATLFDACLVASQGRGKRPVAVAHQDDPGLKMLRRAPSGTRLIQCLVDLTGDRPAELPSDLLSISPIGSEAQDRPSGALYLKLVGAPSARGVTLTGQRAFTERAGPREPSSGEVEALTALDLPLIGDYHPSNLAIALGMVSGTHPQALSACWRSLTQTRGVPGRMERALFSDEVESAAEGRVALVDYAHTPDAITRASSALRAVHQGPLHIVIGCGGDRDRGKRPEMTRAALQSADVVWLTSDNPRSEAAEQIIEDALALGADREEATRRVRRELDRRKCLAAAWDHLPPQGALLITGKGHEDYQEVGARRYRLNDIEAISAAAWAQRHAVDLRDVPYHASLPASVELNLDDPIQRERRAVEVCVEALGRPQGLGLIIATRTEIDMAGLVGPHALISDEPQELQSLCLQLTPRSRWLVLSVESEGSKRFDLARRSALKLSELIAHLPPHLTLPIAVGGADLHEALEEERRDPLRGGWPKLRRGPKIPTL